MQEMKKAKILFVSQEILPFMEVTEIARIARFLPQGIQEKKKEIRTFMPRFGNINERRNQLHEVIRLSGMNLIIDDTDHPLIIKVASIQSARMQVYFIDNEEYFNRKNIFTDGHNRFFKDNDDRTIFFCRGVLETVKKLGWNPDLIHCHGWMTSLIPMFVKTAYQDDPVYKNTKVVYSVYNNGFNESFSENYSKKLKMEGITADDVKLLKDPNFVNINNHAIKFSDAVIKGSSQINPLIDSFLKKADKPVLEHQPLDKLIDAYSDFFDEILVDDSVLVED